MELEKLVEVALKTKNTEDIDAALTACLKDRSSNALKLIFEIACLDLYIHEGALHKRSTKDAAATAILCWKQEGVAMIVDRLRRDDLGQIATETSLKRALSNAAAGSLSEFSHRFIRDYPILFRQLDFDYLNSNECILLASEAFLELILNDDPEMPIPFSYISDLSTYSMELYMKRKEGHFDPKTPTAFSFLFSCMQARWFRFSDDRLRTLHDLLNSENEEQAHIFLKENPQILEPFYARVWSKPRLGEQLIADFVVKQMDGRYLAVEIEKPSDPIVTQNGDLSARTTHAIRQALEYRDWLIQNHLYAIQTFDELTRPSALVVIGNESTLTVDQQIRLRQENESRQGVVKIVGFDWLYERARQIRHNLAIRSALPETIG